MSPCGTVCLCLAKVESLLQEPAVVARNHRPRDGYRRRLHPTAADLPEEVDVGHGKLLYCLQFQ